MLLLHELRKVLRNHARAQSRGHVPYMRVPQPPKRREVRGVRKASSENSGELILRC